MSHRFLVETPLVHGPLELRERGLVNQLASVLRLREGEKIVLCDGAGNESLATVASVSATRVSVLLDAPRRVVGEPGRRVILYLSLLKRENVELAIQKAVEAGVAEIVPVTSDRTVKLGFKRERMQKIIKEAFEQSGRGILPTLAEPVRLEQAFLLAAGNEDNLFFHLGGSALPTSLPERRVGVFVGPEGGWTDAEAAAAREAGCRVVSLGGLTLRAETAAIVGTYLAVHHGRGG